MSHNSKIMENENELEKYSEKYYKYRNTFLLSSKQWYQQHKDTVNRRYSEYKARAKRANHEFPLSLEEFSAYWKRDCSYCGSTIETIGLDRIDNNKGYSIDNITSCCATCNRMKRDMDIDTFLLQCKKIISNSEEGKPLKNQ